MQMKGATDNAGRHSASGQSGPLLHTFCYRPPVNDDHNQLAKKSQAWSALFSEPMSDLVKRYTASVDFDKRLWRADITGSLAHAEMLHAQGILSADDHAAIQKGMAQITAEIEAGSFVWKLDLEDVHLNVEARLTELVGIAGKRLHTGRSRNDQVATDVRLWLRGEIDELSRLLVALQRVLVEQAEKHAEVILPGFTPASGPAGELWPPPAGVCRDVCARCRTARGCEARQPPAPRRRRPGRHQLPAGPRTRGQDAGHGRRLPEQPRRRQRPRLRHRVLEMPPAGHGAHLTPVGRADPLDEPELRLHRLPDAFCTGSSIMPQKKNPDVPELARGKTGRVVGHLVGLVT